MSSWNSMQEAAFVVALNAVVFLCCLRVCASYGRWWWHAKDELRKTPMGLLPVSVFWLSAAVGIEAAYYGTARVMLHLDYANLWDQFVPVNVIRIAVITGALVHMIPYWRTLGRDCLACWVSVDAVVYLSVFAGFSWWLY